MSHLKPHRKNSSHRPTHSSQHVVSLPAEGKHSPPRPFYRRVWWLIVPGISILLPFLIFLGGVVRTLILYAPLPVGGGVLLFTTSALAFGAMHASFSLYKRSMLLKRGVTTTGHVCHSRLGWAQYGKVGQLLVVEFWTLTTPRVRYTAKAQGRFSLPRGVSYSAIRGTPGAFAPTHAEVTYDPQDPSNAHIGALARSRGASWVRLFWAVFFALVAGGILWGYCWLWVLRAYA